MLYIIIYERKKIVTSFCIAINKDVLYLTFTKMFTFPELIQKTSVGFFSLIYIQYKIFILLHQTVYEILHNFLIL